MRSTGRLMFELEQFVSDCRSALRHEPSQNSVGEVVARAVSEPGSVLNGLGEPRQGEIQTLYRANDLTILNVIWSPWMNLLPHNHRMWAVIGIYTGREDNIFWRRVAGGERKVEAAGAKSLSEKEVVSLGQDIIHSVTNPLPRLTGALHVYGGDFFAPGRSEWDAETLVEQACDPARLLERFEEANARLKRTP